MEKGTARKPRPAALWLQPHAGKKNRDHHGGFQSCGYKSRASREACRSSAADAVAKEGSLNDG